MEEVRKQGQHPVIHEGAEPDELDSNERADDRVEIRDPSGEVISPGSAPTPVKDEEGT